jgi:hypothetical protein
MYSFVTMNKERSVLKLLGVLLIAVMATACSPKKTEEQKAPEADSAELQAELPALSEPDKQVEVSVAQTISVVAPSTQLQGSGTAGAPYLIYTEADLRAVGSTFTAEAHYRLMADIMLTGDNDNDPENGNWMPIGGTAGFSGTFNGNGHTITGLRINITEDFPHFMSGGLFNAVDGVVENLGLIDVNITVGTQGIGGIAGVNNGTIQNCYVSGNIGDMYGKGGIVGSNPASGTIRNCFFAGKVFHRREENSTVSGGIAGISSGTVSNCVSLAESVTEEPENNNTVGRVVGSDQISEWNGKLTNNYGWNGTSTGQNYLYYVAVPTSDDPASKNGADLSAAELKTQAAWEKAGFSFDSGSMWVWNGAKGMPSLKNQKTVVPWPEYLENPAVARPNPYHMGETG